jgi:Na+/H+-translocating membrane pyrophosphatase
MNQIVYLVPAFGIVGLLYTAWKFNWVSKQDAGNEKMQELELLSLFFQTRRILGLQLI